MPFSQAQLDSTREAFLRHDGILRTSQAIREGIHPRVLYAMRDAGQIDPLRRGVYRLADMEPMQSPDLSLVAASVPKGVICLTSALQFHGLTTQIPRTVDLAIPAHSHAPKLDYPPIQPYWFSGKAYSEGIETYSLDGIDVRIYSPAKTIADCFKYRNKIGLDIALEALRLCLHDKHMTATQILQHAQACRVKSTMKPYLEALLG
jgi:predicted transcriptional regulator of viral defense system